MSLTPEERFLFDLHGYVVVEDAIPRDRLAEVTRAVLRLTGEPSDRPVTVSMPIERDPLLLELAAHEPLLARVRELVGPHPKLIDNDVIATPRTSQVLGWHRGVEPAWGYTVHDGRFRCLMAKVIYYLTDVGHGDGPTRLVPGSHKQRIEYPIPDDPVADVPGSVELYVRAGSALLFSEALLHAGSANDSGKLRLLAIYNYGPSFVEPWEGYRAPRELVARSSGTLRQLLGGGVVYHGPDPEWADAPVGR